jgi:hypothetical protein
MPRYVDTGDGGRQIVSYPPKPDTLTKNTAEGQVLPDGQPNHKPKPAIVEKQD